MQAGRTSRIHNLNRLNELALAGAVEIFCAHDKAEFDRAQAKATTFSAPQAGRTPNPRPVEE